MTVTHFEMEIEKIKEELLKMGALVEEAVDKALRALANSDVALADEVIKNDVRINELENVVDARCVKLIATHQPVAVDLRFLTGGLRLCAILERIGDQAVNLADRCRSMAKITPLDHMPANLLQMGELGKSMTRQCLDAFVRRDIDLAYDVCCQDDDMDELNRNVLEEMISWMMTENRVIRRGVEIILASRNLERIGDLATNVSEEVVFMVEGRVIRHMGPSGSEGCEGARRLHSKTG